MEDEELQIDLVVAGMTRSATIMGIPFLAFLLEWLFAYFIFIASGNPLLLLIGAPIHGVLYALSVNDPGIFEDIWLYIITKGKCTNYRFWKSKSFSAASLERYQGWD